MTIAAYPSPGRNPSGADKCRSKRFISMPISTRSIWCSFGAYMQVAALCDVLRVIVEDGGQETPWARGLLKAQDLVVVKAIRRSNIGPSAN